MIFRIRSPRLWLGGVALAVLVIFVCTTSSFVVRDLADHSKSHPDYPYEEQTFEDLGRDRLPQGGRFDAYNSQPPTSGSHDSPVAWGVYQGPVPKEKAVGNMEHGGG